MTGAAGAKQEAVSAALTELLPHTQYTFCLRQVNEANEAATSAPVTFTTLAAAPRIEEASVNNVTASSATFAARINPQGAETSYTFEYAPAGGAFAPVPEAEGKGSLPEGTAGVPVSMHIQGLLAHAAYQFRITATNAVDTATGAPVSFATQTLGAPFALPDGRQWEMVSPPQKEGALLEHIWLGGIVQASADGNAITDSSFFEPIEENAAGTYGFLESDFFGRGPQGWASKTITPPHSASGPVVILVPEFRFFSRDLSKAILQPFGPATPLAPEVHQSTAYIRTDYLNGNPSELCGSGCYQPLVSDANTPAGTQYGGEENEPCTTPRCGPKVIAVSPDLSHVLLESSVALTAGSSGGLYEWGSGKLTFVGTGSIGFGGLSRHVISDDGSRVIFQGTSEGMSGLLVRDTATEETAQIGGGGYEDANAEGSKVFFEGKECEVKRSETTGKLECPVVATDGSVLGASEDGSYVYFGATGVLAPGATPATCSGTQPCMNLYVSHSGKTAFIAGLSAEDSPDLGEKGGRIGMASRVSPNGRWLAFMSNRNLTGYDATDAVSGRPDEEVYLYDTSTDKLVCASCNPTGARPVGVEFTSSLAQIVDSFDAFDGTFVAANVPSWTPISNIEASYQSRYLSDSGRLLFDSHDALVPQDVNGTQDVYEYEPAGAGGCSASQATFSVRSGGCVSLISSGESSEESVFLDASETGGDVFFLTAGKLVSQDFDNTFDIYDARECGSDGSRCFAPPPLSPPPCSTSDSCKPAPSPQPALFGSPASATFSGAGNVTPSTGAPALKPKALTRTQRFARALKACHREKGKQRRACERLVHARYGMAGKSRKASATKRSGR